MLLAHGHPYFMGIIYSGFCVVVTKVKHSETMWLAKLKNIQYLALCREVCKPCSKWLFLLIFLPTLEAGRTRTVRLACQKKNRRLERRDDSYAPTCPVSAASSLFSHVPALSLPWNSASSPFSKL